jgi:hypothetical protein
VIATAASVQQGFARRRRARDAKHLTLKESGEELFVEVEHSIVVKL